MVDIDNVYQKVLVMANKEQRGYITPQEFNLLANKAQLDIVNDYFHEIKTAYHKRKNQTDGQDEAEMTYEKLGHLRKYANIQVSFTDDSGEHMILATPPDDLYKLSSLFLLKNGYTHTEGDGGVITSEDRMLEKQVEITRVNGDYFRHAICNPLTKPTLKRPVYTQARLWGKKWLQLYPVAEYTKVNAEGFGDNNGYLGYGVVPCDEVDTSCIYPEGLPAGTIVYNLTNSEYNNPKGITGWTWSEGNDVGSGSVPLSPENQNGGFITSSPGAWVKFEYYKKPADPNWAYVVVNKKALYNANNSVHFDLHPLEEENLVMRILELSGITIQKPELQQSAMVDKQQTRQEQNN